MSFDQLRLDSTVTLGEEELQRSKQKIQELEALVKIYEKSETEHRELETHMRNSYHVFARDIESLKKELAIAELRNQELKEENVKMNAQLSGRVDVLLNERKVYSQFFEQEFWCEIPRYQFVQMAYYSKHYNKLRVRVDLEKKVTTCIHPYEPILTD